MSDPGRCTRCIMDQSDPDLDLDEQGVCHWCREVDLPSSNFSSEQEEGNLQRLAKRIRRHATGKYDSIIGLSGGVDSSYVAYLAWKLGLKPLCIHFDNGWNSEIAVGNIKSIVETCGFELSTYVIDWQEFRDLQRAFLMAGVIDLEMLSDHAINASMFHLRRRYGVRYILAGTNHATEHGLPKAWRWRKQDWRNIKAIHRRFGERKLKTFPHVGSLKWLVMRMTGIGGVFLEPLNQVNFRKDRAVETLTREFGWRDYGGKHYESTITKFYQAYILPTKFGVDKRKAHLSALIRNGEVTRDQAIEELKKPLYAPDDLRRDKFFVLKKLGFTEEEFDCLMNEPPHGHKEYGTEEWYLLPLIALAQRLGLKG